MIFTQEYNFAECFSNFIGGLSVFLIGVTIVFFALVLLILLIKIVSILVEKLDNKDHKKESTVKELEVAKVVSVPVSVVAEAKKLVDDLELVAVITAAIAVSLGTTTDKLVVRSLRQVNRRGR